MYTLHHATMVRASLDEVFGFFNRPENLERLTPSLLRFKILTPPPLQMHNGAVLDYEIRVQGLPMRWTSIITQYDPPHHFVDVQLKGPYRFWHHRHTFAERNGQVEITDDIHYDIGFSLLGKVIHAVAIKKQLATIFSHREGVIQSIFGEDAATAQERDTVL